MVVCGSDNALLLGLGGDDLSYDGKKNDDELILFSDILLAAIEWLFELSLALATRRSTL